MLKRLVIRNYALIDEVKPEFGPGFTVITGETGSGKSIMLGALSLITGIRADSRVAGEAKSYVEAEFENVDPALKRILDSHGIEWLPNPGGGGDVTIRREISSKGRSRIFINDASVTLTTLSEIGSRLLDIHSQHANAKLSDPAEQLKVIDLIAGNRDVLQRYKEVFRKVVTLKRRIDEVKARIEASRKNEEVLRFRYSQLDSLKPKVGELQEIEKRYDLLSDADDIKERLGRLCALLGDGEGGILSGISESRTLLSGLDSGAFDTNSDTPSLEERFDSVTTELRDIFETIEDLDSSIDTDPATLERLSARMQAYYDAQRQFKVTDGDALVAIYEDLKSKLSDLNGEGDELPELEREARKHTKELRNIAEELSETRKKGAREFEQRLMEATSGLGLNNMRFEVKVSDSRISSGGKDKIEFYCAFNKNGDMRRLGETASGGEMSRLMLGLKSVVARHMQLPTVIFDEIDTGVSGDIADRMGSMMAEIAAGMQVFAITHLPQVAVKGKSHLLVYKHDEGERTVSHVKVLDNEERIKEIARMLSGKEINEAALSNARSLLEG